MFPKRLELKSIVHMLTQLACSSIRLCFVFLVLLTKLGYSVVSVIFVLAALVFFYVLKTRLRVTGIVSTQTHLTCSAQTFENRPVRSIIQCTHEKHYFFSACKRHIIDVSLLYLVYSAIIYFFQES